MPGYGNIVAFQRVQAKIEAVRGTAETTMSRWLYVLQSGGISWTYARDREDAPETLRSFFGDRDTALTNESVTFSIEARVSYEELPWWFSLFIKGGSSQRTGTTTGSTPPGYSYTFSPTAGADDIDTFTMKIGDGATGYRFRRCVVNSATLRCNPNEGGEATWRIALEGMAIFDGTTTFDSPTDITRTMVSSNGSKLYLDTTLALGTTQLLAMVRNMSLSFALNAEEKRFIESGATASADIGRGNYRVTGDFTAEALSDTQFALMRANTAVKLRMEQAGAQIGPTPPTTYLLQLDAGQAKLNAPSRSTIGQNFVWTFPFIAEAPAGGVPITAKVVNALATVVS